MRLPPDSVELERLTNQAREYIRAAKAESTLRAYRSDWKHFNDWCRAAGLEALPASPDTVALYLAALGESHRPATLTRRLTSINTIHRAAGEPAPALTQNLAVGETLKGIRRTHGTAQTGKRPLLTAELRSVVALLPKGILGIRDRALLLAGFAGGFRRSELAALRIEDVGQSKDGLVILIRRSKTDQEGQGRQVGIPRGSSLDTCPVDACIRWMNLKTAVGRTCRVRNV